MDLLKQHCRESASGSAETNATIAVVAGDWEVVSMSVIMDSGDATAAAIPVLGHGYVQFEPTGRDGNWDSPKLMVGLASDRNPMVMNGSKYIKGPGNLKSFIHHQGQTVKHTLCATLKRVMH